MTWEHFTVSNPEPGIALVVLTPAAGAKVFQFSSAKLVELGKVFDSLEADSSLKAVVLTGTGKVFAAGADITEMKTIIEGTDQVPQGAAFAATGETLMDRIENSRLFTVAAFNGAAVGGGCELGLACDWRVALGSARFGQPEINLGLIPGWGGNRRLARFIGPARAKWMIFTGELVDAASAHSWGLVQEIAADDALLETALATARKVVSKSGVVLAWCKEAVHAGQWLDEKGAQEVERARFGDCFGTPDTREGLDAFLSKRPAVFRN
ncbi:MAG: enoyl-CoA hydratase/isomerase family protein [Fibrobacteria bacterium]|nr:enoyl-CoA hydratase/isomerase family protein [Fibrobacteria bacterium]